MKQELIVPEGVAAGRLDLFLATQLRVPRSQVQQWLKAERVTVNGKEQPASYGVKPGDHVIVQPSAEPPPPASGTINLPVVYEDADMLVIDKPAGLSVHAGNGRSGELTVADFARSRTTDPDPERPGIVHRLDRDTSGLLVIAKTATAKQYLQQLWQRHEVRKTYQLLVVGRIEPPEAVINLPLGRDPGHPTRRQVAANGRSATTTYRTLAVYPGYTLLEAYPQTGRTHQLRVHFAALGHPVAGDAVYGSAQRPPGLKRQFLHATKLELHSPSGGSRTLVSPLPPDLTSVLTHLEHSYN